MHAHAGSGFFSADLIAGAILLAAAALYLGGVATAHRRGHGWSVDRTMMWLIGLTVAAAAMAGTLPAAGHNDFPSHMFGHVLVGMAAPMLLVAGMPVTLALRSLDLRQARRLSHALRSIPIRFLAHPVTAALVNIGSLWLLYTTPLFELMLSSPLLHLAINFHFLLAGYLFVASLVGTDPNPHRANFALRSVVLVFALAGHGVLAKYLYANPPLDVPAAEAQSGSVLMFYGGDVADAVLIAVLCLQWYRAAARRLALQPRSMLAPWRDHM
jgi:putative membrane protein